MPLAIGTRLGAYEILAHLGAGGMGEVYQGRDSRLNRLVAIKVLPESLAADPVARERLRREAMSAAALDHPFICKVFEIGEDGGALFIAMEFIRGETLQQRLRGGRLPVEEALRIAGEVAEALEEAHDKRLLHRDLKPANVMLGRQGRVKVMDFGLAKRFEPRHIKVGSGTLTMGEPGVTREGVLIGTPDYMAPEQIRGEALDQRCDLFSFGILLCELLLGHHPFHRSTVVETIAAILRDPPNLGAQIDELGPGLTLVMRRLLAKNPADRYESIKDVRADIGNARIAPVAVTEWDAAEGSVARMPLIGRDTELSALLRNLDESLSGRGSLVLISGEPGIGKTHLTEVVLRAARQRGSFAVVGRCYEAGGSPPYGPFVEMLEDVARVTPRDTLWRALGDSAPEVAKLLPELRRMFPAIPPAIELAPEQQRRLLFNAYRDFIGHFARLTPIVVALEDLHWADEPALQMLLHLAQSLTALPVLIIGTYRDSEVEAAGAFAKTLETLHRNRQASHIALRRLPFEGVLSMLSALSGQTPPESFARVAFDATEGNPYFVEEVFRNLCEEGRLFDENGLWRTGLRVEDFQVPDGVRLVIQRRLDRLGETARTVLTTSAVIGRTFSVQLLEKLHAEPDAVLDAVEEGERAHLLVPEPAGREPRYGFVHELVRQTLIGSLSWARRQRLHARIAEAIEHDDTRSPASKVPALAHHLYQAGGAVPAQKAIEYLRLAAKQASEAAAHEEALSLLENALSLGEGQPDAQLAELQSQRGTALRCLGRSAEAVQAYETAVSGYEAAGERVKSAETCIPLVWTLAWSADPRWKSVSDRALSYLGEADQFLRCRLLLDRALGYAQAGEVEDGLRALQQAAEIRNTLQLRQLDGTALRVEMILRWFTLDFDLTFEVSRKAEAACELSGDLWGRSEAESFRVIAAIPIGRPEEAQHGLRAETRRAQRIGNQAAVWVFKMANCLLTGLGGNLAEAERTCRDSLAFAKSFGTGWAFFDEISLGLWVQYQARIEEALVCFNRAVETEPPSAASGIAPSALFLASAQEGLPDALEQFRRRPIRMPVLEGESPSGAWAALANVIEGLACLGRDQEAAAFYEVSERLAAKSAWFWVTPRLFLTAAGIAAACARNWPRSEALHVAAIHRADQANYKVSQAQARDWYGTMLAARAHPGDTDRARSVLSEAFSLYDSLGMPRFARRASDRLARLARPRES